jgi:hypothetical protein
MEHDGKTSMRWST